ncbi:alpha/beta fold hydrolase [Flammeovirga kamogawensis]|uniref:Alpha/beta hydrolase n=1 Tax=Flammeovirga kamogawensis TaxID=373891 RepID=A0ABX8GR40_9BACT|nr:alpha/beta hydrolase [Flammeovirga kamogawensis]MBB6463237.1 pimeloyl-ACP methyl ester carboxylesterase [Flammeovirga kamogawensis]QWG05913.1 alpha/beta hydrolase [Flammeovirga kamogawensis]
MNVNFENRPKKTGQGYIERDGEKIYFESTGEGPAIVFGHGLGGSHAIFFQQVPELAKYYRVITFDQRGFGNSTNIYEKHSPHTAAEDMKAILDHLNIEKAHLVGQSMAGWCMLDFGMNYPERTLSIVFSNSLAGIYTDEIKHFYDIPAPRPPVTSLPLGKHFGLADSFYDRKPEIAFLYVQIGSICPKPPANMRVLIRETFFSVDQVNDLNKKVPMLFCTGSEDITFPPEQIQKLHELIVGSQIQVFEGTAHSPYYELPEEYNEVIKSFCV